MTRKKGPIHCIRVIPPLEAMPELMLIVKVAFPLRQPRHYVAKRSAVGRENKARPVAVKLHEATPLPTLKYRIEIAVDDP